MAYFMKEQRKQRRLFWQLHSIWFYSGIASSLSNVQLPFIKFYYLEKSIGKLNPSPKLTHSSVMSLCTPR